jgi:hypothetical protein
MPIRVEADGQLVLPRSIQYKAGKSRPAPTIDTQGQIEIKTDYLILHMPSGSIHFLCFPIAACRHRL